MLKKTASLAAVLTLMVSFAQKNNSIYELPGKSVFPEGIAYDSNSGSLFIGSASEGTIFQGNAKTGEITTFIESDEREPFTTLGLKVDDQNRLWVAGGSGGQIYAYDLSSAEQTVTLDTPQAEATFLNDLVVSRAGDIYVTDSNRPILFKVAADTEEVESWLNFSGTAFEYQKGTNANGIAITPDDRYLLVVQMDAGLLYRIDVASKEVIKINLKGETLAGADGLVLDGQRLYAVLQPTNEVAVVTLADDFASGTLDTKLTDPSLHAPATAALVGNKLLIVNTQFDRMQSDQGPELPFTISSIPLSAFSGNTAE